MRLLWLALAACGHHAAGQATARPAGATVQVVVDAPGAPTLLERTIVIPLERALNGTGDVTASTSVTTAGRVVLTVEVSGDLGTARRDVAARLRTAELPQGVTPVLAPMTSADGALVRYALHGGDRATVVELRTFQDWTVRPALLRVAGIADVSTCGGLVEQIDVTVDPAKLGAVTLADIATAITKDAKALSGQHTFDDIANAMVKAIDSTPIRVDDVARVERGHAPRTCVAADERSADVVEGTVWLRAGSDRAHVEHGLTSALDAIRRELPAGITLDVVAEAATAAIALPPASLDDQLRVLDRLRGAGATLELGDDDGGFVSGLPDEVRVRAATAEAAAAVAERTKLVTGAIWIGDAPTAWIHVHGTDFDELGRLADVLSDHLEVVERAGTQVVPRLEITPDRAKLAAAHLDVATVEDLARAAQGGMAAGALLEGQRRIPIAIRLQVAPRDLPQLAQVATLSETPDRRVIVRDRGRRRVGVRVRVHDLAELRAHVAAVKLPAGYEATVD